jgi:preprotein translocase subunit SecD
LEGFKTTKPAADSPKKVVLLPGLRGSSIFSATPASQSTRYVLGPSEMNSSAIASATATQTKSGAWVVDWTTTSSGASQWDKIAHLNFHQILAVDVGGVVVSAPIIEPTDKSFKSFHGQGVISGDLSHAEAMRIVQAMESQNG